MKILKITLLLLLITTFVQAQLKNGGFEASQDTAPSLPDSWKTRNIEGYTTYLDNKIKFSGQKSLNIISNRETTNNYVTFSQIANFDVKSLKRISVSAYIKSEKIIGDAGIWCQIIDKDNNMIGFSNSDQKGIALTGSKEWGKYTLDFIVNNKAEKIKFGGYLSGTGSVWFDDFSLAEPNMSGNLPSLEVTDYMKEFNKIIHDKSIFNDSLNWNSINADIALSSKGMTTTEEAYILADYVISKLKEAGDFHTSFYSKSQTDKESRENTDGRQPYSKLLQNNIGYIYVPGFMHFTYDTISYNFADKIQTLIREIDSKNSINGWIVDLRENNGGNMWPMIAGLGPLTGEGILGHFIVHKNSVIIPWFYKNGGSYEGDTLNVMVNKSYTLKSPDKKIAVLIGSGTASSGEMTTIAFLGKPNVKSFGQASGGFTTTNEVIILSDGSSLALSTGNASDRNNKIYRGSISPDIIVEDTDENTTIQAALKWLIEK